MKKTPTRIVAFMLSVMMLAALLPAGMLAWSVSASGSSDFVYVDAINGVDTNTGLSASKAVKTLEKAVELLDDGSDDTMATIYLVGDYLHSISNIAGSSQVVFLNNTRHLCITSADSANRSTLNVAMDAPLGAKKERYYAGAPGFIIQGDMTWDGLDVVLGPDKTVGLTFPVDYKVTGLTFDGVEGTYTYTHAIDTPYYDTFTYSWDSETASVVATPVGSQPYKSIDTLRFLTNAYFEITETATVVKDSSVDPAKDPANQWKTAVGPNGIYMHPAGTNIIRSGVFALIAPYNYSSLSNPKDEDVVILIGGNASIASIRGPYLLRAGVTPVITYILEDLNNGEPNAFTDIFGTGFAKAVALTEPFSAATVNIVVAGTNVTFNSEQLAAATAPGKGTFNVFFDGAGTYKSSLLRNGFYSFHLKGGETATVNPNDLVADGKADVGYAALGVEDGSSFTFSEVLASAKTLKVTSNDSGAWSSKLIPVIHTSQDTILDYLTLDASCASYGSLSYNADTDTVYFISNDCTVNYAAGTTIDSITLPATSGYYGVGTRYTLSSALVGTVLSDGRVFIGWKDSEGTFYQAGDTVILPGLFNVYTAQWGWSSLSNTDVVYLDAIDGLENNNGLTPATAVNTLEKAISLLNGRGKITAGYVYLVKDYSHTVTGSSGGNFTSFPYTRHIILTSDATDKKSLTVNVAATNVYNASNPASSTFALSFTGPTTFDCLNVVYQVDRNNYVKFTSDKRTTKTITNANGASGTWVFPTGEVAYSAYDYTWSDSTASATITAATPKADAFPLYRILYQFRIFTSPAQYFEVTPNCNMGTTTASETALKDHDVYNYTSNYKDINQFYLHPGKTNVIHGGRWEIVSPMGTGSVPDGSIVYIGGNATATSFRGPYDNAVNTGNLTFVFDDTCTVPYVAGDPFGWRWTNKYPWPTTNMNTEIVMLSNQFSFGTGISLTATSGIVTISSVDYLMTGEYTLTLSGLLSDEKKTSFLANGFTTLKLINNCSLTINPDLINSVSKPQDVGYTVLAVEDGSSFTFSQALSSTKTLKILKNGTAWSSLSIPVIYTSQANILNYITLDSSNASIGVLRYDAAKGIVFYDIISTATVSYFKGETAENVSVPVDTRVYAAGDLYGLSGALANYTLLEGKSFGGWTFNQNPGIDQADSTVTLAAGVNTATANWSYKVFLESGYAQVDGDSFTAVPGEEAVLPNTFRDVTVNNGTYNMAFYGWIIDDIFYLPGDRYTMPSSHVTANAVWIPTIYVQPSATGTGSGLTPQDAYTSFASAYAALMTLTAEESFASYRGVAITFVGDQIVPFGYSAPGNSDIMTTMSNDRYTNYSSILQPLAKPLLMVADSPETKVVFDKGSDNWFYWQFSHDIMLDNMMFSVCAHTQMRIMPNGCTFVTGLNLTGGDYSNDYSVNIGGQSLSAKPFGVSFEASLTSDASCKLYGGTISFVYGSINSTKRIAAAYVDNNVNIYQIVLNNTGNWADFSVYILGGRVENLKFGFNGSIYRVAGTFTAYIKGGVVANIMDYGNSAYTLAGYTHLQECTRNLVFDGFRGTTTYYHLDIGNTAENVKASNGLDNLSFINGSSVNFTNHAVHMRSKIGSYVYFDSTSSLQEGSKGIAGSFVANDTYLSTPLNLRAFGAEEKYVWANHLWSSVYEITLTSSLGALTPIIIEAAVGQSVFLPNDWVHEIVTDDNGQEMGFYGWSYGGVFYHAGDRIETPENGFTAEAVWVPAVFVDPTFEGISIGSSTAPYTNPGDAYLALETVWASYPDASGGIVHLMQDTTWDVMAEGGVFTWTSNASGKYQPNLQAASKPVVFHGETDATVLKLWDSQETKTVFYFSFKGDVGFDGLTLNMDSKQSTRFTPTRDIYFGPNYSRDSSGQTLGMESNIAALPSVTYKIYGGSWAFLYCGQNTLGNSHTMYIGGSASLATVSLNNIHSQSTDIIHIQGGSISKLYLAPVDGMNDKSGPGGINIGKSVIGTLKVIISGGTIDTLYDNYGVNTNALTRTVRFCEDLNRILIFDGYIGSIAFDHLTAYLTVDGNPVYYANGLDALILKNRSAVTSRNSKSIYLKANSTALFQIDATSSFMGGSIYGIAKETIANDENATLLAPISGSYVAWNGEVHNQGMMITLGAQIRTESPYGIRFGYEADVELIETITDQAVIRKGALIIPTTLLGENELTRGLANVLDVECTVALSESTPDRYTIMLVDSRVNSDETWLTRWKDVSFTSCTYVVLADGSVIYSSYIDRSIQQVVDALNGSYTLPPV